MYRFLLIALCIVVFILPGNEVVAAWRCMPTKVFRCKQSQCNEEKATIWIEIDFDKAEYRRCDQVGCSNFAFDFRPSGAFVTLIFSPGTLFKAMRDGSEFVEVVTYFTTTLNYFGSCKDL